MTNKKNSSELYTRAKHLIPGGVNSPVRAFKAVGGNPLFFAKATGSHLWDVDGNAYIDYIGSWGPMILGHSHPAVIEAIQQAANTAVSFGAPCAAEVEIAELIINMVPSVEMVRMVNSGTEATMSAIRLARGATGRDKIIKFSGNYHGHGDSFLIQAGSGMTTLGVPNSPGVTKASAADTLIADFNDIDSVTRLVESCPDEIAAMIVEPIAGNMGLVLPEPGFLEALRSICDDNGILLIFDEVMTGFRVAPGGVQEIYGVTPDLTTLGKIIGGGLPVGAYGGKRSVMQHVSPEGPVYQAGTLSGNPLAMSAGLTTLKQLNEPGFYEQLESICSVLEAGFRSNLEKLDLNFYLVRQGSMMCMFFQSEKVKDYKSATESNVQQYSTYFQEMLNRGVYLPPAQFEAMFISNSHTEQDIEKTIEAHFETLKYMFRA